MAYAELEGALTDEQKATKDLARKFAMEVMRPAGQALDKLADPADVIADDSVLWDVFKQYRELGFHKMGISKAFGGMSEDMDRGSMYLMYEQFAYGDVGLSISQGMGMPFTLAAMSPEPELQQLVRDYCEDTECKMVGCWAITEPDHGSDWIMGAQPGGDNPGWSPQVKTVLKGDEYIINGQKSAWVSNGTIATHAVLHVSLDPSKGMHGTGIAVMPLDLPGISRGKPLDKIGQRPLNQGEIFFEEVKLPKKYMVIEDPAMGLTMAQAFLTGGGIGMGIIFSSLAKAAFDEALKYAKERVQGGVPIIEHQNIKLKLFSMFTAVESARAFARRVAEYAADNPPGSTPHAKASKVLATETSFKVAAEAIQIFGSNGLTKEYPIEKMLRDAKASMIEDGENSVLALAGAGDL